jgi:hypothetical protein
MVLEKSSYLIDFKAREGKETAAMKKSPFRNELVKRVGLPAFVGYNFYNMSCLMYSEECGTQDLQCALYS